MTFSRRIVVAHVRQYLHAGAIFIPQIPQIFGALGANSGFTVAEIFFASRLRVWVSGVERLSGLRLFEVSNHNARAIPSAKGAIARRHIKADSDSLMASESIKRQFPSRCSKNHSRFSGPLVSQSKR